MASTAVPQGQGSVRQRNKKKTPGAGAEEQPEIDVAAPIKSLKRPAVPTSEWDYQLALTIITILALVSRFWGITHPNEVVFDEVHFGKVGSPGIPMVTPSHNAICNLNMTLQLVRLVLPPKDVLLRRSSSIRQASLRVRGLARRIRWTLPLREHW
jgi:hypothetical protein